MLACQVFLLNILLSVSLNGLPLDLRGFSAHGDQKTGARWKGCARAIGGLIPKGNRPKG
jgi:hypothetical protein